MSTERLTTLAAVKQWLNISNDDSDELLTRAIDAVSQFILQYLNWESFRRTTYTYNFRGYGSPNALLQNWPVLSVDSVAVGGSLVTASTFSNGMPGSGYYLSDRRDGPQAITLQGRVFARNTPAQVIYEAGFETTDSFTPTAEVLTFTPTNRGTWSADIGVTIDGVPAVEVDDSPIEGQYSVSEWGLYTFAAADVGREVIVSYSYTPPAVSHAATELVGELFKRKDRIGVISKTLGGQETVSFSQTDMSNPVKTMLQPFKNVVPV